MLSTRYELGEEIHEILKRIKYIESSIGISDGWGTSSFAFENFTVKYSMKIMYMPAYTIPFINDVGKSLIGRTLPSLLYGTPNQIYLTENSIGEATISLPQDISTTSSPVFGGLNINGSVLIAPETYDNPPIYKFEMVGTTIDETMLNIRRSDNSNIGPGILFQKSRGTPLFPESVLQSDSLGQVYFSSYNGNSWTTPALIYAQATEDHTLSNNGSRLDFQTTENGTNILDTKLRIDHDGTITIFGTHNTTSPTTGTLIVNGGLGVKGDLRVGGEAFYNTIGINGTDDSTSTSTGSVIIKGGVGVAKSVHIGDIQRIYGTTNSTDPLTGSLIVDGGTGINKDLNVGGTIHIFNTTESSSTSTGALIVNGGVGINDNTFINGVLHILSTIDSTSTSTGAIVINGGIGFGGAIYGNILGLSGTSDSTSPTTGALVINGGVGISRNINIGGNARVYGTSDATSYSTGSFIVDGGACITKDLYVGYDLVVSNTLYTDFIGKEADLNGISFLSNSQVFITNSMDATTTDSGSLQVTGGVGVGLTLTASTLIARSTVDSISTTSGSITTNGGCGVAKNLYVGGITHITNTHDSTSTSTGSLIIQSGGAGVSQNLSVGGITHIYNTIESTNTTTGALLVDGGLGIIKNTNIGGKLMVNTLYSPDSQLTIGKTSSSLYHLKLINNDSGRNWSSVVIDNGPLFWLPDSTNPNPYFYIGYPAPGEQAKLGVTDNTECFGYNDSNCSLNIGGGARIISSIWIGESLHVKDIAYFDTTHDSTDTLSGGIIVSGGVGIAKNVNIGGDLNVNGTTGINGNININGLTNINNIITITDTTESTSPSTGALIINGGLGVNGSMSANNLSFNNANISSTIDSTSTNTGAFTVAGGIGIGKSLYAGNIHVVETTESTNPTTGSLIIDGGIGIAKNSNINGVLSVFNTTDSSSISTGALIVSGGVSISKSSYFDGITHITNTTSSTSISTGSLIVSGGVGIAGTLYPNNLNMTQTVNMIDIDTDLTANSNSRLPTQKATKSYIDNIMLLLDNPTGFPNITDSVLSFTDISLTFTIAPQSPATSFTYYIKNVKYTKTTSESIVISTTVGSHYIYYNGSTLSETTSFTDLDVIFYDYAFVASVYWDGTKHIFLGDQRHGTDMSPSTQRNFHYSSGSVYVNGLAPANFTVGDGSLNSHAQFTLSTGSFLDDDMKHTIIPKALTDSITIYYLSGSTWTATTTTGAFYSNGTNVYYNLLSGATWSAALVPNNYYVLGHIATSTNNRFCCFLGQSTYNLVATARAAAKTELSTMYLLGFPADGFLFIATVIYQYGSGYANTYKCRIIEVDTTGSGNTYIDWRQSVLTSSSSSTVYHSVLSGLGNDDHLQYVLVNGRTTDTIRVTATTESTSISTGCLIISGGVGLTKSLYIGSTTESSSISSGALVISGGTGITKNLYVGGKTYITSTELSTSTSTGSLIVNGGVRLSSTASATDLSTGNLIVDGGVSIAENLHIGGAISIHGSNPIIIDNSSGQLVITPNSNKGFTFGNAGGTSGGDLLIQSTTDTTAISTGSLVTYGGMGITKSCQIGESIYILGTNNSTSTSSGTLVVSGGIGIGKEVYIGSTSNSTSITSGALIISGGVGIGKETYIGSTLDSSSVTTGALIVSGGVGIGGNMTSLYGFISSTDEATSVNNGSLHVNGGISLNKNIIMGGSIQIMDTTNSTDSITGTIVTYGGVGINKNLYVGENVRIYSTIDATDSLTGSLIVDGGTGISKNLFIGGNTNINGVLHITNTTASTSTSTGAVIIAGGLAVSGTLSAGAQAFTDSSVTSNTQSTSVTTGAFTVVGGVGIGRSLFVNDVHVVSTTNATDITTGALTVSGGASIVKDFYVGGQSYITNTTESTSTSTGAVIISGGLAVGGTIHAYDIDFSISSIDVTTESTSTNTGAFVIAGGLGVGKSIYARDIHIVSTDLATNPSSGTLVVTGGVGIGQNLEVGSVVRTYSTIDATDTQSGSVIIDGGVGIAKTLHVSTAIPLNLTMANPYGTQSNSQNITGISTNPTLSTNSDYYLPTERTIKTYVDYHNRIWIITDQKISGTDGGTFTSGAWQTRTLNTISGDTTIGTLVTLDSNQITITAGRYWLSVMAPACKVGVHQIRLANITNTTYSYGMNADSATSTGGMSQSNLSGFINISGTTIYEIQHQCSSSNTGSGFGRATNFGGTEVYTIVTIVKMGINY